MYNWEIDISVLVIFFVRSEQLEKTFNAIKKVRPKRLLLWQDGPRNESDMPGIIACRDIVEQIDWDCEVYKQYNEKNYGCDPSTYYSHKWAFSIVDKCIVLEDDFVANKSFFYFCKELLDRYEFDERINHICGMNMLGVYENCPYDYIFNTTGTNAWASWKRVIDGWDENYSFIHDEYAMEMLKKQYGKRFDRWIELANTHKNQGVPYWETIMCFDSVMNSRLAIISTKNLVDNIGMTSDSTHSQTPIQFLTKTEQKLFNLPTYELDFPLKHPPYVLNDLVYYNELNKFYACGHPFIALGRKIYHIFKYIQYGEIIRKVKNRFF